jgi:hypothetical protein
MATGWAGCAGAVPANAIVVRPDEARSTLQDARCEPSPPDLASVSRSFALAGATAVQVRAGDACCARVVRIAKGDLVTVSGKAIGGAAGYHGGPDWKETPASEWGLSFESRHRGSKLIVSTVNEISYIHHLYYLTDLVITVPEGVAIVLVPRTLDGDGDPDLEPEPKIREPMPGSGQSRCG